MEEREIVATDDETVEAPSAEGSSEPESPSKEQAPRPEAEVSEEAAEEAVAEEEEALPDLDDETFEAIVEGFGDKILSHPKLRERLLPEVEERLRREYEQRTLDETLERQREVIVQQGRAAATALTQLLEQYREAAKKLAEGEEVEVDKLPQPDAALQHLALFGTAIYSDVTAEYDTAFSQGFLEAAQDLSLSPQDTEKIQKIVENARRMQNDPNQQGRAKSYLFAETMKVLVAKAKEVAKKETLEEIQKKRQALEKITSSNALKIALAKKAAQKLPPATPGEAPRTETGGTMEELLAAYEAARDRGDIAEADRLAFEMAALRRRLGG